ncbi:MAG: NUDIX domain-containing protein [Candidatus Faecousia sp.]|nr:NUDIX domain-containing protein [Candidatus Faecousia sp.]
MAIVTFYNCDPKDAPKTTMPAHLGANAIITCQGKLLLEKRRDSDIWGLIGGGCKKTETGLEAIARETYEELGLRIPKERFHKLAVYDNPGRIAAFRDGSIWRMVIVVYGLDLPEVPELRISSESKELRFFSKAEIPGIEIAVTHRDIVEDWFINPPDFPEEYTNIK